MVWAELKDDLNLPKYLGPCDRYAQETYPLFASIPDRKNGALVEYDHSFTVELIRAGGVELHNDSGQNPLIYAIRTLAGASLRDVTRALVEKNVDVNLTQHNWTALHYVMDEDVAQFLIDSGADVNLEAPGDSPLVSAISKAEACVRDPSGSSQTIESAKGVISVLLKNGAITSDTSVKRLLALGLFKDNE